MGQLGVEVLESGEELASGLQRALRHKLARTLACRFVRFLATASTQTHRSGLALFFYFLASLLAHSLLRAPLHRRCTCNRPRGSSKLWSCTASRPNRVQYVGAPPQTSLDFCKRNFLRNLPQHSGAILPRLPERVHVPCLGHPACPFNASLLSP